MKESGGKAAVVVPTSFLTAGTGIPKKIRERIVKERMLRGVVSMPSNIFATTGTNVSAVFLDNTKKYEQAILMDASKLGTKVKIDGKIREQCFHLKKSRTLSIPLITLNQRMIFL